MWILPQLKKIKYSKWVVTLAIRVSLFSRVPSYPSPSPPTQLPAEGHERREKQKITNLLHGIMWQRCLARKTKTCDSVTSSGKLLTLSSVEEKAILILPRMTQTIWQQCLQAPTFFPTKEKKWNSFPLASLDIILLFKGSKASQSHAGLSLALSRSSSKGLWEGLDGLVLQAPGQERKDPLSGLKYLALYLKPNRCSINAWMNEWRKERELLYPSWSQEKWASI